MTESPPQGGVRTGRRRADRAGASGGKPTAAGEPLVVRLDDLRRDVDPAGFGVRRAGSLLGRLGLLARDDGDAGGPRWTIAPEHLPGLRSAASPASAEASRAPQPS